MPGFYLIVPLFSNAAYDEIYFVNAAIIAMFSYIGFVVFGLPFVLILRSRDKLTLAVLFLGGIVAGPLFLFLIAYWSGDKVTLRGPDDIQTLITMSALSAGVAIVFGLISKARIS